MTNSKAKIVNPKCPNQVKKLDWDRCLAIVITPVAGPTVVLPVSPVTVPVLQVVLPLDEPAPPLDNSTVLFRFADQIKKE